VTGRKVGGKRSAFHTTAGGGPAGKEVKRDKGSTRGENSTQRQLKGGKDDQFKKNKKLDPAAGKRTGNIRKSQRKGPKVSGVSTNYRLGGKKKGVWTKNSKKKGGGGTGESRGRKRNFQRV